MDMNSLIIRIIHLCSSLYVCFLSFFSSRMKQVQFSGGSVQFVPFSRVQMSSMLWWLTCPTVKTPDLCRSPAGQISLNTLPLDDTSLPKWLGQCGVTWFKLQRFTFLSCFCPVFCRLFCLRCYKHSLSILNTHILLNYKLNTYSIGSDSYYLQGPLAIWTLKSIIKSIQLNT